MCSGGGRGGIVCISGVFQFNTQGDLQSRGAVSLYVPVGYTKVHTQIQCLNDLAGGKKSA